MQFSYRYKNHAPIDQKTKEYIESHLETVLNMLDSITRVNIELEKDKHGFFCADVSVQTPKHTFHSCEKTDSVSASIDLVKDELKTQIRRHKEKERTLTKRGKRSIKKKLVVDDNARF